MSKYLNKIYIITLITLLTVHCSLLTAHCSLKDHLKAAQTGKTWMQPGEKELLLAEKLFKGLFNGEFGDEMKKEAAEIGCDLIEIQEGGKDYLILSEKTSNKTGRGFYLFPRVKQGNKVLQIPHSFKDLYTGDIGLNLALEGNFSGIAWNTVPRYFTENNKRIDSDLSDLFYTFFAAFTRAFALTHPQGRVIQLHGFSKDRRKTKTGSGSDMILSTGNEFPGIWMKNLDKCLEQKFSKSISVYPFETKELGATKTSIGIILRQMGNEGFVHVEMSKAMRIMMRDNKEPRKKFLECLQDMMSEP